MMIRLLIAISAMVLAATASAQNIQRIAAIVNDEVVSGFDVDQRIRLVMISTGLQDTPEVRNRLRSQILRTLIDERLQVQEATRLNISVADEEIERALRTIERQNNIPEGRFGEFVSSRGVGLSAVTTQVEAALAWQKLIRRTLQPRVTVTPEEVDAVVQRLQASAGRTELLLAEIFLSVDNPAQEPEVRRRAENLIRQIRSGARFPAVAREFSQAVTAAGGGDMGWVQPEQLSPELADAVADLRLREISSPIRVTGGYYILTIRDQRQILGGGESDIELDLKQILLPLDAKASPEELETQVNLATAIRGAIDGCGDVESVAAELNSSESGSLGKMRLGDLPVAVRPAVADLQVGEISEPVRTGVGVHLFMVCGRSGDEAAEPDTNAIRDDIGNRRLSMMARRYLRDLRRDAVVELR